MSPIKTLPCLEQELDDCLNKLAAQTKSRAKAGYNDACKHAEVVIRNLMNVLYGYSLQLEGKVNASGFDLCDTTNKILVQVTVNCTDNKVEDCLRTTCERVTKEPHLNNATLYIMFLTVDDDEINKLKKNAANKLGKPEDSDKRKLKSYTFPVTGIQFTPADSIISLNTLLQQIRDDETSYGKTLTIAQMHGIQEILEKYYQTTFYAAEFGNQLSKNGSSCFTPAPGASMHGLRKCGLHERSEAEIPVLHREYAQERKNMIDWLLSINVRWGPVDTAPEMQNANTCEGLIAVKNSNYKCKSQKYLQAFESILGNMGHAGLCSKSLCKETVVCTAMLLELAAMERKQSSNVIKDFSVFDRMAEHLWSVRNPEYGWGVYVAYMADSDCLNVNTCRALLALQHYPKISESAEYFQLCQQMFESEVNGKFGFFVGGSPKLTPTAMFTCLFYRLSKEYRDIISQSFDVKAAVDYVYKRFVDKNVQFETESLIGIEKNGMGVKKAPWNHITVGFAMEALAAAYENNMLSKSKWENLLKRIDSMLTDPEVVIVVAEGRKRYHPEEMELPRSGNFTFPTTYLVNGLCAVEKACRNKEEK